MRRFAMNNLARKDLFFCLGIWLAIEAVSFLLLPALRLAQPSAFLPIWVTASILFGIGGALLMALGTQLASAAQDRPLRRPARLFISLLSWLGLVGIAFPLLYISVQIFEKLFTLVKQ
ncbi:hypothetical protein IFO70_03060 [Phormidium tenue FACHB-886]|nr:hypothetical protein [Phormidium tenue FACHB-886]